MVEVLVTALILSLGLLGLAGLQVKSMQFNHSAYLRSQASLLAYDITDRMRANAVGTANGNYNVASTTPPGPVAGCTTTTGCTPAQMAQNDLDEWKKAVAAALPGGKAVSCLDDSPDDGTPTAPACNGGTHYAIKIWWTDDKAATQQQRFAISFRP